MDIKKILTVISTTVLLPISSFVVMMLPFVYFIEKIVFYLFSILLIYLIINKINWLKTKRTLKIVYFILLYSLGCICFLLYCVGIVITQRQLLERDIYTSGIYCIEETRSWDNEIEIQLMRYDLSGSRKGNSFVYKNEQCDFHIKKNNNDVFLDGICDDSNVEAEIGGIHRIKFDN